MTDAWHTELTQDGDRWSFTLTLNGVWHSGGRNYRSRAAALAAADWHRAPMSERPSIADDLAALGLFAA
jgi:hypothetical protein